MAVTSDQLLVNVAVDTASAAKSLDLLAKELGQLRGEFQKTGKVTEETKGAVTDFGFSAVKLAGVFTAVEKSAKLVGKAMKFAFGDQFMKDAADQFDKLGAEISSAIGAGLDVDDLGKEAIGVLKDVVKAFQDIKPAVSEAVADVKDFVVALKDGLMAVNWAEMAKLLGVIGAALLVAFGPAIISAVAAFAASMAAAAIPIAIIALKIGLIAIGLGALAATVAIVVKNFDLFRKMISEGLLLAFTKAKVAMLDFGMSTIQLLTKIIAKAGELFPAFAGTAVAAVQSLSGSMTELADASIAAQADAEMLGTSLQKAVGEIDLTPVTNIIDSAKAGWDAFTGSIDKSSASAHNLKSVVRLTTKQQEELNKRAKELEDLHKKAAETLKTVSMENAKLGAEYAETYQTAQERIAAELEGAKAVIDMKIKALREESDFNEEAIAALEAQKGIVTEIAKERAKKAPSQEFEKAASVGTGIASSISQAFSTGALGAAAGMLTGVSAIADVAQAIIDFIPSILNKIAGVFSSLADLPMKILEGFQNIFASVLKFVANFIPNIIKMIDGLLEAAVGFIETLPDVLIGMLDTVPDMILGLINKLPALAIRLVNALIGAIPKLITSAIDFIVKDAPKIIMALMKTLYIELPKAILKALISALKAAGGALSNLFKGAVPKIKIDTAQVMKTIKQLGRTLSGEASKVFAVMDLGDESKKAADKAKDLAEAIEDGMTKSGNWLKDLWDKIVAALKAAWMWIYDTFLKPFVDLLQAAWKLVYDTIIKPFVDSLKAVWSFIYESVLKPFLTVLRTTWTALVEYLKVAWNGLVGMLTAAWDALTNTLKAVWEGITSIFKNLWDSVKSIWDTMMQLFSGKISFMEAVGKIWETMLETARVAWDAVSKVFGTMFDGAKKTLDSVVTAFSDTFNAFRDGASKIGTAIWDAVKAGFEGAGDLFKDIGTKAWDSLKDGFKGIGKIIKDALDAINPGNLMKKMFKFDGGGKGVVEKALSKITGGDFDVPFVSFAQGGIVPGEAVTKGDSPLNDRILALLSPGEIVVPRSVLEQPGMYDLMKAILEGRMEGIPKLHKKGYPHMHGSVSPPKLPTPEEALGAVKDAARPIADRATDAGKMLGDNLQAGYESLKDAGQELWDQLALLDPQKLWDLVKDRYEQSVMSMVENARFHSGGLVPSFAQGGEVPALLQPGEFVMSRGGVSSVGIPLLEAMNAGRGAAGAAGGDTNIEMNFDIKTTEPIDESFFRNRLMPKIKEDLRRSGLDGQRIVPNSGVY